MLGMELVLRLELGLELVLILGSGLGLWLGLGLGLREGLDPGLGLGLRLGLGKMQNSHISSAEEHAEAEPDGERGAKASKLLKGARGGRD